MRTLITGGTGLIGHALSHSLVGDGHEVLVLSRNATKRDGLPPAVQIIQWDAQTMNGWERLINEVDVVVNLAGESLAGGRWTDARKQRILDSRVTAGQLLVKATAAATRRPIALIQASAVGYYGSRRDEILDESSGPGSDYLARVCFDWEASTAPVERMGVRRAIARTGIVLSTAGGALPKILLPFKLFAGGPMGDGRQWWPWIHIQDEVAAIRFLMENERATGPFNLTTPAPLTNREFAAVTGNVMGRPAFLPAPAPALKLALGEMSTILLDGQRALPRRLQDLGFEFNYPTLEGALRDFLG